MDRAIRYWQHRVSYEGGLDILRTSRRLTIGFSDIAADSESCDAMGLGDWNKYCQRYKAIYKGNIPRNKAVLWRFVVEMSIGDVVVVPVPCGFQIYKITSEAIRIENSLRDLGWYRSVEEITAECTPREAYASQLVSAMRCQKTNIEITRLSSEVEQAIEKKNAETGLSVENEDRRPYRMGTPDEIAREMIDGVLNIPDVQRGYVWNATQVELLWDSILRQIPVGTFSVRPKRRDGDIVLRNNQVVWDLVDGQQRATSIEIAYHVFPPSPKDYKKLDLSEDERMRRALSSPILWIDLNPNYNENTTRKYYFRVTTEAQPWGYKVNTKEKGNETIEVKSRREFVTGLEWHHKRDSHPLEDGRPFPAELWPKTAGLPIPFQLVSRFLHEAIAADDSSDMSVQVPSFRNFIEFCKHERDRIGSISYDGMIVSAWNWFDHFFAETNQNEFLLSDRILSTWECLAKDVLNIKDFVIFQQNALMVNDGDIGVYFKRIGRGGSVPSEREIAFSLLKVRIPDIKSVMDDIAREGITSAAHMTDIAMRVWYSLNDTDHPTRWNVSNEMLMRICEDEDTKQKFRNFVTGNEDGGCSLRSLLKKVDSMLGIDTGKLLRWHRAQFCSETPADRDLIYQYLLMHANNPEPGIDYAGLASFLLFHANNLGRVVCILHSSESVKDGLIRAYKDSYYSKMSLTSPVFLSQLKIIQDAVNSTDWIGALDRIFNSKTDQEAVELLKNGYGEISCYGILLYATRRFVDDVFPNYDKNNPLWAEENCPWDYDHILPRSWLENGARLYNWDQEHTGGLLTRVVNSLGNLAPLPFSLNRAKSDSVPTASYPFDDSFQEEQWVQRYQDELVLSFKDRRFEEIDYTNLQSEDPSVETVHAVCARIVDRMIFIYESWFLELEMDHLLDFSQIEDPRKDLLSVEIESRMENGWRLTSGGKDILCMDQMRTEFNWKVHETIELARQYNERGQSSEIVYVDRVNSEDVGFFYLGIRKIAKSIPIKIGSEQTEFWGANDFIACKEEDSWQVLKKYNSRPSVEVLDKDIEFLEGLLANT